MRAVGSQNSLGSTLTSPLSGERGNMVRAPIPGRGMGSKLGEYSHQKHLAPLGEIASGRGQGQFAVFHPFGANELVGDAANFPALPPDHQHLQAVFRIEAMTAP
jgi:hypothetical protein